MGSSLSKVPPTPIRTQPKHTSQYSTDKSGQSWDYGVKQSPPFASTLTMGVHDDFSVVLGSPQSGFTPPGGRSTIRSVFADPPPMYSPLPPMRANKSARPTLRATGGSSESHEDALELLKQFDTVILLDDSASMLGSRWAEATKALADVAHEAGKYDANGIDIHFLNSKNEGKGLRDKARVANLLGGVNPRGMTPLAARLEKLTQKYMDNLEKSADPENIKPINYIVITDGEPTDDPETVIRAVAKRLDSKHWPLCQLGIQLIQIGGDTRAQRYLQSLDDDLQGIRDIVDTTPYPGRGQGPLTAATIIKILLGGINRRVDRKGGAILLPS